MPILRPFVILASVIIGLWGVQSSPGTKPDFSGTWKLKSDDVSEVYTIEHREPAIRLIMRIEDGLGKRTLDMKGVIDGREHKQIRGWFTDDVDCKVER
jgi:hypothetical protein